MKDRMVSVPMPEEMADDFKKCCDKRGQTMSGVAKMLIWTWMEEQREAERLRALALKTANEIG